MNQDKMHLINKIFNNETIRTVWDKEDDIAIKAGRLSGIIKELKALSDQSIEEIRSSEIEAIVAECTNIPIGKIQAREKDRLLSIESKLQERVKGPLRLYQMPL